MVNWSRAHFEFIADTVRGSVDDPDTQREVCAAFDRRLQGENPRYDSDRFMSACLV